jgi:hypothetical protein
MASFDISQGSIIIPLDDWIDERHSLNFMTSLNL